MPKMWIVDELLWMELTPSKLRIDEPVAQAMSGMQSNPKNKEFQVSNL